MHSLLGLSGKLPTLPTGLPTVFIGAMARRLAKVPGCPRMSPASQKHRNTAAGSFLDFRPWGAWYSFDGSLGSPGLACQKLSSILHTWIETC